MIRRKPNKILTYQEMEDKEMNTAILERPIEGGDSIGEELDIRAVAASRRIGKRATPDFYTEEELEEFLSYLDTSWQIIADDLEETEDEFENWNKWFKKEKKHPPEMDRNKVLYLREEFNAKRSPHLWKSNPNRKWILAFGNAPVNNVVSAILYKYQNETISKDA